MASVSVAEQQYQPIYLRWLLKRLKSRRRLWIWGSFSGSRASFQQGKVDQQTANSPRPSNR